MTELQNTPPKTLCSMCSRGDLQDSVAPRESLLGPGRKMPEVKVGRAF